MFERFTDRARRVVVLAQEEARALNHNYIGTEHILLGLLAEGEGVAAQVLGGLGLDLPKVRQEVQSFLSGASPDYAEGGREPAAEGDKKNGSSKTPPWTSWASNSPTWPRRGSWTR